MLNNKEEIGVGEK